VHWNEKNRMLKLLVPMPAGKYRYLGQVAYGVAELPANGDEAVAQKWTAVVSKARGTALTCINEGTYGSDFARGELRLTLLRSPAYSAHPIGDRQIVPQDRFSPRVDQGERTFRFWLRGGPTARRLAAVDREAVARNEAPMALSFYPSGRGRKPRGFVELTDDVVQVSAIKRAERGDGLVIRLFEPTGRSRSTVVSLPFAGMRRRVLLRGFEAKTLHADWRAGSLREVDMTERPVGRT